MSSNYVVKRMYHTLQGEGPHTGKACILLRMVGCNMWDGLEKTKAASACPFCDSQFRIDQHSMRFPSSSALMDAIKFKFAFDAKHFLSMGLILTGGEPLLQLSVHDINYLSTFFAWVDVETNGSVHLDVGALSGKVTVICSPKDGEVRITPHVWKILYPDKKQYIATALASGSAQVLVQPVDGPDLQHNYSTAVKLCKGDPRLRLSIQVHKVVGLD